MAVNQESSSFLAMDQSISSFATNNVLDESLDGIEELGIDPLPQQLEMETDDDDDVDFSRGNKIQCICQIVAEFDHIDLIMCCQCSFLQHAVCIGYLYSQDVVDKYACPSCKFDDILTVREIRRRREISVYRLVVGYSYFTKQFPHKVLEKLSDETSNLVLQKLQSLHIILENNGQYIINIELIGTKFLKEFFRNSYNKRIKVLHNSATSEDANTSEQDSITLGAEHSKKKRKRC